MARAVLLRGVAAVVAAGAAISFFGWLANDFRTKRSKAENAAVGANIRRNILTSQTLCMELENEAASFLSTSHLTKLSIAMLIRNSSGAWELGQFHGDERWYPASCVKLVGLPFAASRLRELGLPDNSVEPILRPVFTVSSNEKYGALIDALTGSANDPNINMAGREFEAWAATRASLETYYRDRGLLGDQCVFNKTYPSNSGTTPRGAEQVALKVRGRNRMTAAGVATLMAAIASGALEPQARDWMLGYLNRPPWSSDSVIGIGTPPGSRIYSKLGSGGETTGDVAYVVLPNGREFVLAVFCDGRKPPYKNAGSDEWASLGDLTARLLRRTGLLEGCEPPISIHASQMRAGSDAWQRTSDKTGGRMATGWIAPARSQGSVTGAVFNVARPGRYEVSWRYPDFAKKAKTATIVVTQGEEQSILLARQDHFGDRRVYAGHVNLKAGPASIGLSDMGKDPGTCVGVEKFELAWQPAD